MITSLRSQKISDLPVLAQATTLAPNATLDMVLDLFTERKADCAIIVDGEAIAGIFTERDFIHKIAVDPSIDLDHTPISAYMTKSPKSVKLSDSIFMAVLLMRMGHFRHVVVTTDDGKLAGVLAQKEILDYLFDQLNETAASIRGEKR